MNNITIALAGNPNAGKTSLFNALTGARQSVGNYPGVTVAKREGFARFNNQNVSVIDLPGTYSLSAYSQEELVARDYLVNERPEVVVDVIDANNLERNLYLGVQFMELGVPMVICLNMIDEVRKRGVRIDTEKLSKVLNVPVVETVGRSGEGKGDLLHESIQQAQNRQKEWKPLEVSYGPVLDPALHDMEQLIEKHDFLTDRFPARWVALKYLEKDRNILSHGKGREDVHESLLAIVEKVEKKAWSTMECTPEAIIADYRYGYIKSVLSQGIVTSKDNTDRIEFSDKLDKVLTHGLVGPLIMLGALYGMFYLTFTIGEIPMGWLESFFGWLGETATNLIPDGLLQSLIVSGVIDGVGGVLGFVPLIWVMFLMISFLEDSGYMARMAYMLDRVMRMFGLHGASVMPFIVSGGIPGGCAVPGVMASRTLRSPKEKLATLLTAPFMACGAKVPVLILLTAAFFKESAASALFITTAGGWLAALLVARAFRSSIVKGEPTPFVMELPPYRLPTLRGILIHSWERVWQYAKKAGTVILAISILLWGAMTFPGPPDSEVAKIQQRKTVVELQLAQVSGEKEKAELESRLTDLENLEGQLALRHSVAGRIGTLLEPVSEWAGFDWRTNIALLGGVVAKEVIVSSLGTAYSLGEVDPEESGGLSDKLVKDPGFTVITAISLMIFVMLYSPCFVTVVAIAKESNWKWATFSAVFNTVLAFGLSVLFFQIASVLII